MGDRDTRRDQIAAQRRDLVSKVRVESDRFQGADGFRHEALLPRRSRKSRAASTMLRRAGLTPSAGDG
jgi:hypothetical protein